jgi:hypothetical protein
MDLTEIGCQDADCIYLPLDRDQWRASLNTEMNICVFINDGKFLE